MYADLCHKFYPAVSKSDMSSKEIVVDDMFHHQNRKSNSPKIEVLVWIVVDDLLPPFRKN